jgi:hypothetical protein
VRLLSILLFLFLLLFAVPATIAQSDSLANTPVKRKFFPSEYGPKKWKFMLGLDARRSFFRGAPVKINGIRTGLEFKGVHRFGLGFYVLKKQVVFTDIPVNNPAATDTSRVIFNVGYSSLFYERVLFKSPKWEFSIPTEFSGGEISGLFEDTLGVFKSLIRSPFSALTVGFQTKYYILPWLAPRVSVGYRYVFNTIPEVKGAFNRPYYSFGVQILLSELYQAVFKPTKEEELFDSDLDNQNLQ